MRQGRMLGLVTPQRAVVPRARCLRVATPKSLTGRGDRRAAARPPAAGVSQRRGALPVRPAGGDRTGAVRRNRAPVPDPVLGDVPAARRGDLAARGGWRRRAVVSGCTRGPAARREPRRCAGGAARERPELAAGIGGSTRPGSLKCLHAHAAFALARPRLRARRADPRGTAVALAASCCTAVNDALTSSSPASSGGTGTAGSRRRAATGSVTGSSSNTPIGSSTRLRRRLGQSFTLDELAAAYDGADDGCSSCSSDAGPRRRCSE